MHSNLSYNRHKQILKEPSKIPSYLSLNSIINVAGKREVRIVPTRGQESVTFGWEHVQRLKEKQSEGKKVHVRYFGDLDPSGEG